MPSRLTEPQVRALRALARLGCMGSTILGEHIGRYRSAQGASYAGGSVGLALVRRCLVEQGPRIEPYGRKSWRITPAGRSWLKDHDHAG